jgi:hypothetical protein
MHPPPFSGQTVPLIYSYPTQLSGPKNGRVDGELRLNTLDDLVRNSGVKVRV